MPPAYRKGLRKPVYTMGGQGSGAMFRDVWDGESQLMYGSYGELTSDQKRAGLAAAGIGVIVALGATWTFAVGPWAVKQFKPEWGYGKRLVTSFLAGTAIGLARRAVSPALPEETAYGWMFELPSGWFGGDTKATHDDQIGWALSQIQRAKGGDALSSMYGPGCCTTGTGDVTASTFTQSPTNTNGAYLRVAYYLALSARLAMGVGWDKDSVQRLIDEADSAYDAGSDSWQRNDAESISEVFSEGIAILQSQAAKHPSRPLPEYSSILSKLANMGDISSIDFSQEQNIGVSDALAATGADILHKFGIGEGGAVAEAERAEEEEREEQRRKMRPVMLAGIGVIALGAVYFFFIKED